jgi:nicotinamide mononucleotide transporter
MYYFDINTTFANVWGYSLSYIEFVGTLFGLLSVYFATRQNILTWSTGIINVVCFFLIFSQVSLYSDMFLQVYFFIVSLYGWFIWKRKEDNTLKITQLSSRQKQTILIILVLSTGILGYFIEHIHLFFPSIFTKPASYPYIDTFIAISSIIANVLLARKILENWLLWILTDILCVFVYFQKNILFISIEYFIFLSLAIHGLSTWKKSLKS